VGRLRSVVTMSAVLIGLLTVATACSLFNPLTARFAASPSSGPAPLTVSFDASGSSARSEPLAPGVIFHWHFGDGVSMRALDAVTTTHTYENPGAYQAKLVIVDLDDNIATATHTIVVTSAASSS